MNFKSRVERATAKRPIFLATTAFVWIADFEEKKTDSLFSIFLTF
jgi:hypothetical protein